jgi:hypothetical protein
MDAAQVDRASVVRHAHGDEDGARSGGHVAVARALLEAAARAFFAVLGDAGLRCVRGRAVRRVVCAACRDVLTWERVVVWARVSDQQVPHARHQEGDEREHADREPSKGASHHVQKSKRRRGEDPRQRMKT